MVIFTFKTVFRPCCGYSAMWCHVCHEVRAARIRKTVFWTFLYGCVPIFVRDCPRMRIAECTECGLRILAKPTIHRHILKAPPENNEDMFGSNATLETECIEALERCSRLTDPECGWNAMAEIVERTAIAIDHEFQIAEAVSFHDNHSRFLMFLSTGGSAVAFMVAAFLFMVSIAITPPNQPLATKGISILENLAAILVLTALALSFIGLPAYLYSRMSASRRHARQMLRRLGKALGPLDPDPKTVEGVLATLHHNGCPFARRVSPAQVHRAIAAYRSANRTGSLIGTALRKK